ncbi:N-acetylneuraminate synthase family protein [uncultured Desulfobacter sp.]|uniref:N-acetylneuraminate synthase family protein n=1 Tax=uncultured Desulfobacter sp. TaxID=240139 RepID=UPI0029F5AF28|nr:N-acetylneuraminate synthase family protein [uncultured Desulfobacter sp.]
MIKPIQIGKHIIGNGRTFIIAELGYNFNTLDEAFSSIDALAQTGADAIKFQTFRAETITSQKTFFPSQAGSANQFEEFKQYELSQEQHVALFKRAMENGLLPFSTPSYFDDVDLLEELGVHVYKIGSDDLTNLPFLDYVARKGKPMIISTGMSYIGEVDAAVRTIHETGNKHLVVLHCTSNYPLTDYANTNLRAVLSMRDVFKVLVGYSDHSQEDFTSLAAVSLGACVIEKHFTLSRDIPAPDCAFSYQPNDMARLVKTIRNLEAALGDGLKKPAPSEKEMRQETRKSVIAKRDIEIGEAIGEKDFIVKRPGTGISPALSHIVPGRKARQRIEADTPITWAHL